MYINRNEFNKALKILIEFECIAAQEFYIFQEREKQVSEIFAKELLMDAYDEFLATNQGIENALSDEQYQTLSRASNAMGFPDLQYVLDERPAIKK